MHGFTQCWLTMEGPCRPGTPLHAKPRAAACGTAEFRRTVGPHAATKKPAFRRVQPSHRVSITQQESLAFRRFRETPFPKSTVDQSERNASH